MEREAIIEKPVIFIGTGRSGSTYISGAIFSHEELAYPSNYIEKLPGIPHVNYLRYLFDNKFWRLTTRGGYNQILAKSFFLPSESYSMWRYLVGSEVDFSRGFLLEERASPELKDFVVKYFEDMVLKQGKSRLAFKITGPSRIGFLLSIFPDAQFIWVKRELFSTLRSFVNQNFWKSRGYDKLWFTGAYSEEEIEFAQTIANVPELITAFQLKKIDEITEREIALHKPSVLTLNYEHFLDNPGSNIKLILGFLGLNEDGSCFKYIERNPIKFKAFDPLKVYSKELLQQIDSIMTSPV